MYQVPFSPRSLLGWLVGMTLTPEAGTLMTSVTKETLAEQLLQDLRSVPALCIYCKLVLSKGMGERWFGQ